MALPYRVPIASPPDSDTAAAHEQRIRIGVRLYFRWELADLWRRRRKWFLYERYRWAQLDRDLEADIRRYCRGA